MPLPNYGVLCGTFNRFEKESPDDFGKWFHGFVYVNTPVGVYQCAVDVNSPTGEFEYMMLGGLDPAMFANVSALPDGYHELPRTPASGANRLYPQPVRQPGQGVPRPDPRRLEQHLRHQPESVDRQRRR